MENCTTGVSITTTEEKCGGNYISTDCSSIPNNINYLELIAGANQTKVNAAIVTALMAKDVQIAEIPVYNGSETAVTAGTNVTITGIGTNINPYILTSSYVSVSGVNSGIVDNTSLQELGGADKLINGVRIGRGGFNNVSNTAIGANTLTNNVSYVNTAIGVNALASNTTGGQNTAVGYDSILSNSSGGSNTAIGVSSLKGNTTGNGNTAIGQNTFRDNTTGSNNTVIGHNSATAISGEGSNSLANNGVFIGMSTKALVSGGTNEIVIGYDATGAGSNTVTLGNTGITKTVLRGAVETNGSFINSTAPATNILLANGATIAQSSIATDISGKVDKVTGKSLISDTEITRLASVSNVDISGKANLASPTFTGVPLAPTATAGTNTTQVATTAFVTAAEAGNVKTTGMQFVAGEKYFSSYIEASSGGGIGSNSYRILAGDTFAFGYASTFPTIGRRGNHVGVYSTGTQNAAFFDTSILTSYDRTYTFPDKTGTFALVDNSTSITATNFISTGVQEFADNAAAVAGGLVIGTHYRTGDLLKIVH